MNTKNQKQIQHKLTNLDIKVLAAHFAKNNPNLTFFGFDFRFFGKGNK